MESDFRVTAPILFSCKTLIYITWGYLFDLIKNFNPDNLLSPRNIPPTKSKYSKIYWTGPRKQFYYESLDRTIASRLFLFSDPHSCEIVYNSYISNY